MIIVKWLPGWGDYMAARQKQYTLYIDESETSNRSNGQPHFCMAGAVIQDREYGIVENEVNNLKRSIWNDYDMPEQIILHQKNILAVSKGKLDTSKYPEYERFRSKSFRRQFYSKLAEIFDCGKIRIVGGCIDVAHMEQYYNVPKPHKPGGTVQYRNQANKYLITMQLLLENYCHFLVVHNGIGRIVYEYISEVENERICLKFYQMKLTGSMYISREAMYDHLMGIHFVKKGNNNAGLQVADFIPNAFARDHAGFGQLDQDDTLLRKMKYYRYDGNQGNQDRYGIKYMP